MIKLIIFDFDGTLADTERWTLDIYNELAVKYGYPALTLEEFEEMKKMPLNKIIASYEIPYTKMFSLLKEGQKILKKHINDVSAFEPDLKAILIKIGKMVGAVGIISSNTKKNIRRFCKNKDIDNIDFIISSPLFTKEVKIFHILNRYKIHPQQALYVGDEVRDIESSKKAGVQVAAATWGYNDRILLEQAKPDYLIDNINDLLDIIRGENTANTLS